MQKVRIGIIGVGAIGLASAAWISQRGFAVGMWSPRSDVHPLMTTPLTSTGLLGTTQDICLAPNAQALSEAAEVLLIAVPANGHRAVMDAVLPHLRSGQLVIVSAMSSLSSLYLYEAALAQGKRISVASFGATALTARRTSATTVNIMTRRASVGVSCLPQSMLASALATCETLFGGNFVAADDPLATTLSSTAAVGHVPLALFNWTRIERAEVWPQYRYMTPQVSSVIEMLDAERLAVANAFGLSLPGVAQNFIKSFKVQGTSLAEVATALHEQRGGPPGPTAVDTRYLTEDVPFGLVCLLALARMADVATPVTELMIANADLVTGRALSRDNDLLEALGLPANDIAGLQARARAKEFPSG